MPWPPPERGVICLAPAAQAEETAPDTGDATAKSTLSFEPCIRVGVPTPLTVELNPCIRVSSEATGE